VAKEIRSKKRCCKDRPRCKRCPVTCKRLAAEGYLERLSKRRWIVVEPPGRNALKAARVR
jgi:hypothetical protein